MLREIDESFILALATIGLYRQPPQVVPHL